MKIFLNQKVDKMNIEHPPVIQFSLKLYFSKISDPDVYILKEFTKKLSDAGYQEPPRIKLHSSKGPDPNILIGPLRYVSEAEGNEILIFSDSIQFIFHEYPSFDEILPKILTNFYSLTEDLEITSVNRVTLSYVDIFDKFPQNGFSIKSYFHIYLRYPQIFTLDNTDFIFGIKLETEEENHVPIVRLKGRKPDNDEKYLIQLETIYNINEEIDLSNRENLENNINFAHDRLVDIFKEVLTQKTKIKIGMDDGTNTQ